MSKRFLTAISVMLIALMVLVFGMVGCEQTTGPDEENEQGSEQTYGIDLSQTETYAFPDAEFGYKAQTATKITVTNIGTEATGELTVALSGDNADSFTLGKKTITSIAVGKKMTFTVKPNTGLSAGLYTATVTVSGDNDISASFDVSFTVNNKDGTPPPEEPTEEEPTEEEPDYGISLDVEGDYTFPEALEGYKAQEPLAVTITNTGKKATGKLTIVVSNTDFTLDKKTINTIAVDKTAEFTVVPKTGLKAGSYAATVTVSGSNGISAEFEVSFEAGAAVFGIELSQTETLVFPPENAGYKPLTARDVTITNTGNVETGTLTLTVSNENFRVNNGTIASIAVAETAAFTVVPGGNLAVGPYSATVTVSGSNGISEVFEVSFVVTPVPEYGISLDVDGDYTFPEAILGYDALTPHPITVTNIGNQPTGGLTIGVTGNDFTLNKTAIDSLAVKGEDSFTVVPMTGLAAADEPYTATVSVTGGNGISKSFEVSFTVIATYGVELSETGPLVFDNAILGYPAQAVKTVTISNSGNQETGALTIGVTGADFTLDKQAINNIAVGGSAPFTVVPKTGLAEGTHTATVTVSGGNGIFAGLNVSFTVTATYGITLNPTAHTFPEAIFGYGAQEVKTVNISNTGDQSTGNLTLSVSNGDFVLAPTTITGIAINDSAPFTVVPALGLSAGTHTATVTVSGGNGITASFGVSFYVIAATYGVTLSQTAHTFPEAIFGYGAQTVKTVNISNTGNQPTGNLTLSVSNGDFVLDPTTITNIDVKDADSFTVVPALGLSAGTHTATVTVSGGNGITASFGVSFYVIAATYGVTLSRNGAGLGANYTHPFGTVTLPNYTLPTVLSVTVTNSGNQATGALTVALGGTNNTSFTVAPTTITGLAVNGSDSFTVVPNTGLAAGTYSATVTVSGDANIQSRSFGVSFVVNPPPISENSYLMLTDGTTTVEFGVSDLPDLCDFGTNADSAITINGQTIVKNTIKKVVIGAAFSGVTALPDYFCRGFSNLTELDINGFTGLTSIGKSFLLYCRSFNQPFTLPSTVTSIGATFLHGCTAFDQPLTLPSGLTSIGSSFMEGCEAFNQPLVIPEGITSISDSFLRGCYSFDQPLVIPEGVTSIDREFLYACKSFNRTLVIPEGVTSIGLMFLCVCDSLVSTVTILCPVTAFSESDVHGFHTYNEEASCFTTGMTIAGPYTAAIIAKFPNRNDPSPGIYAGYFRKLIAASN